MRTARCTQHDSTLWQCFIDGLDDHAGDMASYGRLPTAQWAHHAEISR